MTPPAESSGNRLIVRAAALPALGSHRRQTKQGEWVVVGRNTIAALNAAAVAAVNDDLLPLQFEEGPDRCHQGAAGTCPVAGPARVDVTRGEAERAMVPVMPTGDGRSDKGATAAALERLPAISPLPRPVALLPGPGRGGRSMRSPTRPIADGRRRGVEVNQAVDIVTMETSQGNPPKSVMAGKWPWHDEGERTHSLTAPLSIRDIPIRGDESADVLLAVPPG